MKVTIGLAYRLEREIYRRPLIRVLKEALAGEPYVTDVYAFFHEALRENGDTRMSLEDVGEEILKIGGSSAVLPLYCEMLTYALSGDVPADGGNAGGKKK